MAWIEKREGKRGTTYRVGWRDPSRKLKTRTFTRQRDARDFLKDLESQLFRRRYADPRLGDVTVGEFWKEHLAAAAIRASTWHRYETHGRLYIAGGPLGDMALNAVTVGDVKAMFASLSARGVGTPTQESVLRIMHRLFEVALEEDRVSRNPVRGVRFTRTPRRQPRFLDPGEVKAIAGEVPDRYRALVYLLAYGGLRIGEASALQVGSVDLTRGVVHVRASAAHVRGKWVLGETKTGRERAVPVPPFLREMLAEHLAAFGNPKDPEALVFTGPKGAPIRHNDFRRRMFQPAARRAGIEPVPTVHDLRHTSASLMAKAGLSMRDAQDILGHSRTTMTDRYTHLWPDELAEKVAKMDEMGRGAVGPTIAQVVELP